MPQCHSPKWCLPAHTPPLTDVSTQSSVRLDSSPAAVPLIDREHPEQKSNGEVCTSQLKLVAFLKLPRGPPWKSSKPSGSLRCPHPSVSPVLFVAGRQLSPVLSHHGQLLCPAYRHGSCKPRSNPGAQQLPGPDFLHEEAQIFQAEDVGRGHL